MAQMQSFEHIVDTLCDLGVPLKSEGKLYGAIITPALELEFRLSQQIIIKRGKFRRVVKMD